MLRSFFGPFQARLFVAVFGQDRAHIEGERLPCSWLAEPGEPTAVFLLLTAGFFSNLLSSPARHELQATSSTLICMPQHRNTANRIFGGFLMHRAYEVAFCAAFMFGGSRPRFSEIDEVGRDAVHTAATSQ